jgi:hypothetical protein
LQDRSASGGASTETSFASCRYLLRKKISDTATSLADAMRSPSVMIVSPRANGSSRSPETIVHDHADIDDRDAHNSSVSAFSQRTSRKKPALGL